MNSFRPYTLPVLFFCYIIASALPAQKPDSATVSEESKEETYPVRIILEPRQDAKFYQVEWLEHNGLIGQAEAPAGTSLREKVTRAEIRTNLPVRFRYFRLRSAYRDGLFGPWGPVVEIQRHKPIAKKDDKPEELPNGAKPIRNQDAFAQVIDRNGKEKWVLRGGTLALDKLDRNNPLFYEVECLTEKDAPENTNGRKKYEGPVPFTRNGQFKLSIFKTDDPSKTEPIQTWIFWVYTEKPRTYVKFYAPFLHGKGGFTVGGKTKIGFFPLNEGAPIDKIEYRIYAEGTAAGTWQKYSDDIEVLSFAKGKYGYYIVEFQATNVAGSVEEAQSRRMLMDARAPVVEEGIAQDGVKALLLKDENFPIVVRIYQNGKLIEDKYFKQWRANDIIRLPAEGGVEVHVIDLLGNETVIKK